MNGQISPGQLTRQLRQVLEQLERSGISHLQRLSAVDLDPGVVAGLERIVAASKSSSGLANAGLPGAEPLVTANASQTLQSSNSQPISQVDAKAENQPTGSGMVSNATSPPPSVTSTATSEAGILTAETKWKLPVLDDASRQSEFAVLNSQVQKCQQCTAIVSFRQQTVFGSGTIRPQICFVGEAPGADEDRIGEPFVGRAGQLLTKIIGAMKLRREDVYILNALKCRPPQNRTPSAEEIVNCRGFLQSQLEILKPEYIVCLGAVAVRSLLNSELPIGRLRGKFHQYRGARVVITYHPSYLLRNESAKRLVWEDMKMLMAEVGL